MHLTCPPIEFRSLKLKLPFVVKINIKWVMHATRELDMCHRLLENKLDCRAHGYKDRIPSDPTDLHNLQSHDSQPFANSAQLAAEFAEKKNLDEDQVISSTVLDVDFIAYLLWQALAWSDNQGNSWHSEGFRLCKACNADEVDESSHVLVIKTSVCIQHLIYCLQSILSSWSCVCPSGY